VARVAGLSKAAASMALQQHPNIPEATRRRVEEAAAGLGYQPSAILRNAMRQMRRGRSGNDLEVIAWLAPVLRSGSAVHPSSVYGLVRRMAPQFGYRVDIFPISATQLNFRERLLARGIRGAILDECGVLLANLDRGHFQGLKVVAVDEGVDAGFGIPRVVIDYETAITKALHEGVELGYRRFGLMRGLWRDKRLTMEHTFYGVCEGLGLVHAPVLHERGDSRFRRELRDTIREYGIECMLTEYESVLPGSIARIHLRRNQTKHPERYAGLDIDTEAQARAALLHLNSLLAQDMVWEPTQANSIVLEPKWVPGPSAPVRRTKSDRLQPGFDLTSREDRALEPIALEAANQPLTGPGGWISGALLKGFRSGERLLAGVRFQIRDGSRQFIHLRSATRPVGVHGPLPSRAEISYGSPCRSLFFLHACANVSGTRPMAWYRFHFDEEVMEVPVRSLGSIRSSQRHSNDPNRTLVHDWWSAASRIESSTVKPVVHFPEGEYHPNRAHLYVWKWGNPYPKRSLVKIEIESDPEHPAAFGVLAVTAMK